jgi:cell division protein FtsW
MAAHPVDVAPARVTLPDPGLGRGWEASALMALTLLILSFGLVTLFSASPFVARRIGVPDHYFVAQQAIGAAVGLVGMVLLARLPYRFWQWVAWPLVVASLATLLILILPGTESIAPVRNGARRWLTVGVNIQPSELAKFAIIVWTAMMAVKKRDQFRSLSRGLLPFLVVWGALLLPISLQPDLSTAFLAGTLGILTVFAAGARLSHFAFLGVMASPVVWLLLQVDYRQARLASYVEQLADPLAATSNGAGYQFYQAMVALGSGGITGQGFGKGWQKFGFLPEPHNDFIFSMVGEEWGFMGVTVLVGLYLALILVGYRIARRAPDLFGQLLALGCTNFIALQGFLHIGVGVGLLPTTGLALPLFSYGRSNLLVTLAVLGILMAVARETDQDWRPGMREAGRAPDLTRMAMGGGRA